MRTRMSRYIDESYLLNQTTAAMHRDELRPGVQNGLIFFSPTTFPAMFLSRDIFFLLCFDCFVTSAKYVLVAVGFHFWLNIFLFFSVCEMEWATQLLPEFAVFFWRLSSEHTSSTAHDNTGCGSSLLFSVFIYQFSLACATDWISGGLCLPKRHGELSSAYAPLRIFYSFCFYWRCTLLPWLEGDIILFKCSMVCFSCFVILIGG